MWNGITGAKLSVPGLDCNRGLQGPPEDVYVDVKLGQSRLAVLAAYGIPVSGEEDSIVLVRRLDRPRPPLVLAEGTFQYPDDEGVTLDNLAMGGDLVAFNRNETGKTPAVLRQRGRERAKQLRVSGEVLSVDTGRILLRTPHGLVAVDAFGKRVCRLPTARQAKLDGRSVVVLERGVVRMYDVATGVARRAWRVAGAGEKVRLSDVQGGITAYFRHGKLHLLRLGDDRPVSVRVMGAGRVRDAALEHEGLFYAGGQQVAFVPRKTLLLALRK